MNIEERIISHINYRDIFSAPVKRESLEEWLGASQSTTTHVLVDHTINNLKERGLIVELDGYLAVPGKSKIIKDQEEKIKRTKEILSRGKLGLKALSVIPFVKFIGISGSIAAENPTAPSDSSRVDLDIFIITAKNTLWVFTFFLRLIINITEALKIDTFYCMNYITDESFLEIHNKNFFTATELVNLMPIKDSKGVYDQLINENMWYKSYYHEDSVTFDSTNTGNERRNLLMQVLWPLNYLFFSMFCAMRSLKKGNLKFWADIITTFDPSKKYSFSRVTPPGGGYQYEIKKRFVELLQTNFKDVDHKMITKELFPENFKNETMVNEVGFDLKKPFASKYVSQ